MLQLHVFVAACAHLCAHNTMYPPPTPWLPTGATYALPGTLTLLPFSMIEGFVWTAVVYWIIGLAPDAGRFFLMMLLCMLTHVMAVGMFRAIGALGRNLTIANTFGSFFLALVFLTSGITLSQGGCVERWVWKEVW